MSDKSSKQGGALVVLTLGLSATAAMADMVIIPVADHLFADFAGVSMGILNYILSGPALVGAFSALICGRLMSFVRKKILFVTVFCIIMVGSIAGDFVHNAYYMAGMRTLAGIALGAIVPLALAIISDLFIDEKKRSSVLGIYNGCTALVSAVLGWASGMVASIEWRLVFRIYLVSIPILLMIVLFVPRDRTQKIETGGKTQSPESEKMPWLKLMLLNGALFVYNTVYGVIFYQISMVATEKAVGDVSFIGVLSALGTVGAFSSSLCFGLYYGRLKRFTPSLALPA
jgi:MFS family permease